MTRTTTNIKKALIQHDLIMQRKKCCETLRAEGYHIRLNRKFAFEAEYQDDDTGEKYWEEIPEQELVELIQEVLKNDDFIDDTEVDEQQEVQLKIVR